MGVGKFVVSANVNRQILALIGDVRRGSSVSLTIQLESNRQHRLVYRACLGGWIDPYGPDRKFYFGSGSGGTLSEAKSRALAKALAGNVRD